jgi:hypothetical protein
MTWTRGLKRDHHIDVLPCIQCGGAVRIVASIWSALGADKLAPGRKAQAA